MTLRVGTMNERDTIAGDIARSDLAKYLAAADPDVLSLQEWGRSRDGILQDLPGRKWVRGPKGGGPVVYKARMVAKSCRSIRLSRSEFVGHLVGRRPKLGTSWATEAVLEDMGENLVVINYHLTAEVQMGAGYRRDLAHRTRVMRHKREKRRLGKRARWHLRRARTVYVCGDSNYAGMTLGGFVSCWDRRPGGTLGGRAVDIVFAEHRPTAVKTFDTHSDHRAVVVTYS